MPETFLILRKTESDIIKTADLLFLSDVNET